MNKYLPSKKFLYLLGSFLVLALVFFVVFKLFSSKNNFFTKKDTGKLSVDRLALAGLTVNELVKTDSDGDGIPDWEESLWGTDKNNKMSFDNITDSAYITGKKKELNIDETKNEEGLTETEKFAREFFSAYVAMKASGNIDANAINNFSSALGQRVVTPDLVDQYFLKDIKTSTNNTLNDKITYYNNVKKLFEDSKKMGVGDELGIVEQAMSDTTNEDQGKLTTIAKAYQDFASNVIKIAVPNTLANEHLKIVNSAYNTGVSVSDMVKVSSDPIVGLSGISQYQKYSDELISAVADLEVKIKQ